jgi:NAD-dependent dihydropyrimidine dehydrogenase PreA subunit
MSISEEKILEEKFIRATQISTGRKVGARVSEYEVGILKITVGEENVDFIIAFDEKISLSMKELKVSLKNKGIELTEQEILKKVNKLCKNGVMMDQPNSKGEPIYRVLSIGRIFDYIFMRNVDENDEIIKELSRLKHNLDEETRQHVQKNYDRYEAGISKVYPMDRTIISSLTNKASGEDIEIIIDKVVGSPQETIVPVQTIQELIEKWDDIAVGQCYCRNHAKVLGNPCKETHVADSCFTFGKSARHTSKHGFSRLISKEEASDLMEQIRDDGLVYKAMHLYADPNKRVDAICTCCTDCCPQSKGFMMGPTANYTNYLAQINPDLCTGCGTCVEKCHQLIMEVNDDCIAERDENSCIGCGVCAYLCPENAISMVKTPLRIVRLMPDRQK